MSSSDGERLDTGALVARELGRAMEPVVTAIEDGPEGVSSFLEDVGFDEAVIDSEGQKVADALVSAIGEPASVLSQTVLAEDPSLEDLPAIVDAIASTVQGVQRLDDLDLQAVEVDELGVLVLDHLLVSYLQNYHRSVHSYCSLLGIIERSDGAGAGDLNLSAVSNAVQNPAELPSDLFNWGDDQESFLATMVVLYLKDALWDLGVPAAIEGPSADEVGTLSGVESTADLAVQGDSELDPQLRVPIISYADPDGPTNVVAGVKLVPLPARNDTLPGMAVVPFGKLDSGLEVRLGNGWMFNVEGSGDLGNRGFGIQPTTDGELDTRLVSTDQTEPPAKLHGSLGLSKGSSQNPTTLLGDPDGTRLDLTSVGLSASIDYTGDDLTIRTELPTTSRFVVSPSGGFLSTVLPEDVSFDFDATVGYSTKDSIYFEGGGAMEATIPMQLDLGFGKISEVYLALDPTVVDADLAIEAATSPSITLGPLQGRVKRMGVQANLSFPSDNSGSLGAVDLDLGFRPPDGIGLSVDAGPVSGGGFLTFEPEKHRYSGGLELQFSNWGLQVIGLLKTKVPGTDGYSLLLLVTADLPPVQLGFGFVMTGIGGLAGIHRDFKKKPLGKAVRSGNLDSVLFPENVVENADQIITDLRAIFPPKADLHVFGPMIRLGWGTPVMIRAELGVLVAIPSWKIALLGKFLLDLPDEEAALIDINLAVVGVLDIPNKELSIDASLYDSRLVLWTISGDMAMRASWGSDSRFMLSVGGFHPKYSPPSGFPELDRVKASLSPPGGNPRFELTGYLAVTPNTFQVGAGALLHGTFGPAVVHGELSFDALFHFNPFEFVVDFYAKLSVKIAGKGLGLGLDGTLSGPQPYRVKGKLSIDLFLLSVTVKVKASFGTSGGSRELPTATILPELVRELGQPANWSVQNPESDGHLVTLRDPRGTAQGDAPAGEGPLLAHPLGTMAVRQQVVPLGVTIEKYGNAKPAHDTYEITSLSITGVTDDQTGPTALREKFAPAKFKKMSDSEKLQSEAFEELPAGRTVENDLIHYAGADDPSLLSWATLDYEASVIDQENPNYWTVAEDVTGDWSTTLGLAYNNALAEQSAVATAETRTSGSAAYKTSTGGQTLSVSDQAYVVVWTETMQRVSFEENPEAGQTQTEARDAMADYVRTNDVSAADLQVVGTQEVADASGGSS